MPAQTRIRKKPGPRRTLAQEAKDALAFKHRALGKSVREVAEILGYQSLPAANRAVKRGAADVKAWGFDKDEIRILIVARIHLRYAECQKIIEEPHYHVTASGKVAMVWDEEAGRERPVMDSGPRLRALQEQRQLDVMLGQYSDVDPPSKRRVETVTRDAIEARIEELEADLGRNDAEDRRPG
jgi:hypothetical protein